MTDRMHVLRNANLKLINTAAMESALDKAAFEMGYTSLRQKQRDAVLGFLNGRDVFVSLPTGSGKTLCYAILPKVFDILRGKSSKSVAIVVSPLISLMKDQVHSLETKGVSSIHVTKNMSDGLSDSQEQKLYEGGYQILFFSPEAVVCDDTWREMIQTKVYKDNIIAFIIDEAHLVKKW